MKVSELLSREEIRDFTRLSDVRGFQALAVTWLMIAGAFVLAARFPSAWAYLVAVVILGGRQLALAILMHDCAHFTLFHTSRLNEFFGSWFSGYPVWLDLKRYRKHHLRHHQFAGSERDPDLDLVTAYPVTRASFARKILRDLSGLSGLRRVYGLILMDLGFIEFTVSSRVNPIPRVGRSFSAFVRSSAGHLHGVVIANAILFLVLYATHHPALYGLWIIAYLTAFSVILRIRAIAEHACTEMGLDPLQSTRTTYASFLARVTVAPHRVNYHLDHHVLMATPYFRLPRLHQRLKAASAYRDAFIASNYLAVLRVATRARTNAR